MSRKYRTLLFLLCAFQALFAVGFFFHPPFALALWPWKATSVLSYVFISSIFAAAAASTCWSVASTSPPVSLGECPTLSR